MNYEKIYECLVMKGKGRLLVYELGYELHHIIPRSLGGDNDSSNLVKFNYREHLLAHKLLVKIHNSGDSYRKMQAALWFMLGNTAKSEVSFKYSREYEATKVSFSHIMRGIKRYPANIYPFNKAAPTQQGARRRMFNGQPNNKEENRVLYEVMKDLQLVYTSSVKRRLIIGDLKLFSLICNAGFDGVSGVSEGSGRRYKNLGIFKDVSIHGGGRVASIFTDDFKVAISKHKDVLDLTDLFNIDVNYNNIATKKIHKGILSFIREWNTKHTTELLGAELVGRQMTIYTVNNWDVPTRLANFLFKKLHISITAEFIQEFTVLSEKLTK